MANKIYRGGVIPYIIENEEIKMMFMIPSIDKYGGPHPQIAKGKIEEGEETEDGAFREAQEELGLFKPNCKNIKCLGTVLGRTTVYVAEVKDMDKFGDPCHETKEVKWMTPEEFNAEGRQLHKAVVKAAVRKIQE